MFEAGLGRQRVLLLLLLLVVVFALRVAASARLSSAGTQCRYAMRPSSDGICTLVRGLSNSANGSHLRGLCPAPTRLLCMMAPSAEPREFEYHTHCHLRGMRNLVTVLPLAAAVAALAGG